MSKTFKPISLVLALLVLSMTCGASAEKTMAKSQSFLGAKQSELIESKDDSSEIDLSLTSEENVDELFETGQQATDDDYMKIGESAPTDINPDTTGMISEGMTLTKWITYSRHGAATDYHFLFEGEWEPYQLKMTMDPREKLTALGQSQCWAMGKNMRLNNTAFIKEVLESESYKLNTVDLEKNTRCVHEIFYGLQDYTPYLGDFDHTEYSIVKDAIEMKGNCEGCSEESKFPFHDSQSRNSADGDEDYLPNHDLVELRNNAFLDLDNLCKPYYQFLCLEAVKMTLDDVQVMVDSCPYFQAEHFFDSYYAIQMLFKHSYHLLPWSNGYEKLSEDLKENVGTLDDGVNKCFLETLINPHNSKWALQAIFARLILEDLSLILKEENDVKYHGYVVHNNNLISLLGFLIGFDSGVSSYVTSYASTLSIEVWHQDETDKDIIRAYFNGDPLFIRGGEHELELGEFMEILSEIDDLGGDLKDFCDYRANPYQHVIFDDDDDSETMETKDKTWYGDQEDDDEE